MMLVSISLRRFALLVRGTVLAPTYDKLGQENYLKKGYVCHEDNITWSSNCTNGQKGDEAHPSKSGEQKRLQ